MDDDKTVFNDPDKLKRTRQQLAEHFQPQPGGIESKIKGFFGVKDEGADPQAARKQMARRMVYGGNGG